MNDTADPSPIRIYNVTRSAGIVKSPVIFPVIRHGWEGRDYKWQVHFRKYSETLIPRHDCPKIYTIDLTIPFNNKLMCQNMLDVWQIV